MCVVEKGGIRYCVQTDIQAAMHDSDRIQLHTKQYLAAQTPWTDYSSCIRFAGVWC
jgi:hypothetical protein